MITVNAIYSFLKTDTKGIVSEHNVYISVLQLHFILLYHLVHKMKNILVLFSLLIQSTYVTRDIQHV